MLMALEMTIAIVTRIAGTSSQRTPHNRSRYASRKLATPREAVSTFTAGLVYSELELIWSETRRNASVSGTLSQTRFRQRLAIGCALPVVRLYASMASRKYWTFITALWL